MGFGSMFNVYTTAFITTTTKLSAGFFFSIIFLSHMIYFINLFLDKCVRELLFI